MNETPLPSSHWTSDALQTRFAKRIAAHLEELSARTPSDIEERLRFARLRALVRAQEASRSAQARPNGGGTLAFLRGGRWSPWWVRLGSLIPLVVLLGGLALIQERQANVQIAAAAEIDAAILGSDLPPAAYADPGFVQFLKAQQD
jgi:hypothetical protein